MRRAWMAMAWLAAGPAVAADLVVVSATGERVAPTPLEWVRYVEPRIGRDVVAPTAAGPVATIEWRRPVEVRVRAESGAPLTAPERAAVLALAQTCDRGAPRGVAERSERSGTYVVTFDCVWVQGLE